MGMAESNPSVPAENNTPAKVSPASLPNTKLCRNMSDALTNQTLKTQIDELPDNSVIVKDASAHLRKTQQANFWEGLI